MDATAIANTAAHSHFTIISSVVAATVATIAYLVLMAYRHRRFAATGAVGRLFIEVWFLTGTVIFAFKLISGQSVTEDHEDYAFLVLGLGLSALICVKHIVKMFASASKPKPIGWEPSTENADE